MIELPCNLAASWLRCLMTELPYDWAASKLRCFLTQLLCDPAAMQMSFFANQLRDSRHSFHTIFLGMLALLKPSSSLCIEGLYEKRNIDPFIEQQWVLQVSPCPPRLAAVLHCSHVHWNESDGCLDLAYYSIPFRVKKNPPMSDLLLFGKKSRPTGNLLLSPWNVFTVVLLLLQFQVNDDAQLKMVFEPQDWIFFGIDRSTHWELFYRAFWLSKPTTILKDSQCKIWQIVRIVRFWHLFFLLLNHEKKLLLLSY